MRFSSWYDAEQIEQRAPAGPGVFQVRVAELIRYPTGRSAMIHYGAADQLRAAMLAWAQANGPADARYRHADDLGSRTPEQALEILNRRFNDRFGRL
jgi:hypothetical protein